MSTAGLVEFFMLRRKCSFTQAHRLAERVVIRRKLQLEKARTERERAQLALPLEADPLPVPETNDPSINF